MKQEEEVERLLLIDAPCQLKLSEGLPAGLHGWFDEMGLLGLDGNKKKGTPDWLIPHFDASIRALSSYTIAPLSSTSTTTKPPNPKVHILHATAGVCLSPDSPRPPPSILNDDMSKNENVKWLLNNRTDTALTGWEKLVGKGRIRGVKSVEGANHFTLIREGWISEVGRWLGRALGGVEG